MSLQLNREDQATLDGKKGEALQFAMELVVRAANSMGAPHLVDADFAHIDACHYYGRAHLDFARFFLDRGARFAIPAWTNAVPVSLVQAEVRESADERQLAEARQLADFYVKLGCYPAFTCAPYQLPNGPVLGQQIIVGESNAVSFYNSAVGARTNKYGDFLDVCTAMTGRVPFAGLHTDAGRRGEIIFNLDKVPVEERKSELFCHLLGILIGRHSGHQVPVILGLPEDTPPDNLKAIAAAGASSGGVCMFHAVGVTPEAPTLAQATGGEPVSGSVDITLDMLAEVHRSLSPVTRGSLSMVALGTPHFSISEFERTAQMLDGRRVSPEVTVYISTSRFVAEAAKQRGCYQSLCDSGVNILVDTCTYFAPAVRAASGRVMTNSAKWAYYAPGMLPVEVAFASLEDCIESAVRGEVKLSTPYQNE